MELLELRSRLGARRDHALLRFVSFVKSEPPLLLNRAQRGAHRALCLPLHVGHALLGRALSTAQLGRVRLERVHAQAQARGLPQRLVALARLARQLGRDRREAVALLIARLERKLEALALVVRVPVEGGDQR